MNNKLYSDFSSIEDFVWDDDFRQWVLNNNEESELYWNNWLLDHQDKKDIVVTAKQVVKSIAVKDIPVSDNEISSAIQKIMLQIDDDKSGYETNTPARINWFKYAAVAASLILVASVALFFIGRYNYTPTTYKDLVNNSESTLTEKVNTGAGQMEIDLEDGSKVTLEKNARISFASRFTGFSTRKVYLTGKATFEVAKNPEKPFFVYTNKFVTKVLGTKFTITSNDGDKSSTVEVISGVVAVFPLPDKKSQIDVNTQRTNSLVLTRNQKASYSNDEKTLVAAIVAQPIALKSKVFDYAFIDAPLKRIFKNIEDSYGIEIIYDEKILANRTFTADMSNTTMYEKLNIICKIINAHYETIDGKVVIYANPTHNN